MDGKRALEVAIAVLRQIHVPKEKPLGQSAQA